MKRNIKRAVKEEAKDVRGILGRLKRRDFSGNTGQAVKNSSYQLATTIISRGGALIFTVILARLLMPELFGLYGLVLSTILLFEGFSGLGVAPTLIRFVSLASVKKDKCLSKAYTKYLFLVRIALIVIASLVLIGLARGISTDYYGKPIFTALLVGTIYLIFIGLTGFVDSLFQSANLFKLSFYKEIFFQISRILIVLGVVILFMDKTNVSRGVTLVILALGGVHFLTFIFSKILAFRNVDFLKAKKQKLSPQKKKVINNSLIALSATALSGMFFNYIDTIMLGRYVLSEFIGFYRASFSLIGSLVPLIAFSTALFPLFSRMKGKQLKRGFKKSLRLTLFLSLGAMFFVILFAPLLVNLIFGKDYTTSIILLWLLSPLIISFPLISLYTSLLISKGKSKIITNLLLVSTLLNIILNYVLITQGLQFSYLYATIGAVFATLISQYFYLAGLIYYNYKE